MNNTIMNVNLEAFLRALALFLGVFFTTGWSIKSPPVWDTVLMVMAVFSGMAGAFTSGKVKPPPPPNNIKAN